MIKRKEGKKVALSTETLYKALYSYSKGEIENLDDQLKRFSNENITASNVISIRGDQYMLINLLVALQQEIREKANKKAGKGNISKAMQAVIKSIPDYRPSLKGYFLSGENKDILTVCDGFRIIRSFESFEVGELVEGADITSIMDTAKKDSTEKLELPTLGELKAHIKLKKAEQYSRKAKYIIYDFGEDLPVVNAEYLFDILTAFPEARAYKKAGQAGIIDAIYFEAEGGDGVLLPLRK